ncbi:MAG: hypothetical protein AAFN07_06930 [Pseudomonadota bacterium]
MSTGNFLRTWMIGLLLLGACSVSNASTIDCDGSADSVCSATRTVIGSDFSVFAFEVTEASFFDLSLLDYAFPTEPLTTLTLLLTTGTRTIGSLTGEGVLTFFAGPGDYFIQVFAAASSNKDVGLYGIDVAVNPVPLPPAMFLLGSGLIAFIWFSRRRAAGEPRLPGPSFA